MNRIGELGFHMASVPEPSSLATLGFGVWYLLFAERVTQFVQSVSPDEMFRCTLAESAGATSHGTRGVHSEIVVETRSPRDDTQWEYVKREPIPIDDSARRSNYSITWEYDAKHRTTGVTVFGDYGRPPFPGEIIFKMPLGAARAKQAIAPTLARCEIE